MKKQRKKLATLENIVIEIFNELTKQIKNKKKRRQFAFFDKNLFINQNDVKTFLNIINVKQFQHWI